MARRTEQPAGVGSRPWVVPPAIMNDPGEEMSELNIFSEHQPGDAFLLFMIVRDLVLWGRSDAADRGELFSPEAGRERFRLVAASRLPAEVVTWLDVLASVLHAPSLIPRSGAVTEVCQRVTAWARTARKGETAIAFAQAAAIVDPMDARAAMLVGETAAAFGRLQRADTWLQRAIAIGRRVGDWGSYSGSYEKAGWLALRRGQTFEAEGKFHRALRMGRRKGVAGATADALIGLLKVSVETGRIEEAIRWYDRAAKIASRIRGGEGRLAAVSVDLWMITGEFVHALDCLDLVRLDATTPAERMHVLARTAHAAAGAGDLVRLSEAWPQAWELAKDALLPRSARLRASLELHRAAALAGDTIRAGHALRLATDLAAAPRIAVSGDPV